MAPKKTEKGGKAAASQKVAVDKTFGMKNKNKSAKVQKFVHLVEQQEKQKGSNSKQETEKLKLAEKRKTEQAKKDELSELFNTVQTPQKVPFGVDPKSILCVYFKAGKCEKGAKCKFSHDPSVERRSEKRGVYTDVRDERVDDTMDTWDDAKLHDVVQKKHGVARPNETDIVCRYFLEAIEVGKYGWFWECPNGPKCIYKHALPPDYVLRSHKKESSEEEKITLEQFIEEERHKLPSIAQLTPITDSSFNLWRKKRAEEIKDKTRQPEEAQATGRVTGRSYFESDSYTAMEDEDQGWDFAEFKNGIEEIASDACNMRVQSVLEPTRQMVS